MDEEPDGIKTAGRNINNLIYANDTTLMSEIRGPKEPLDEGEMRVKRLALRHNIHDIQSHHFLANIWRNNGNGDFWGGSKIIADGDCSHEIKRSFLL